MMLKDANPHRMRIRTGCESAQDANLQNRADFDHWRARISVRSRKELRELLKKRAGSSDVATFSTPNFHNFPPARGRRVIGFWGAKRRNVTGAKNCGFAA